MVDVVSRRRPAAFAVLLALLASLVVVSRAEATTYFGCVKKSGAIRLVSRSTKCRKSEKRISFNSQGIRGPAGAPGANGKNGANGANGLNGANGTNGTNGTTGFTSTLPKGATEFGTFAGISSGTLLYMPLSFNIPLAAKPAVHIVKGSPTTECPGTAAKPQAASGNVCIYAAEVSAGSLFFFDPIVSGGASGGDVFGLVLGLLEIKAGDYTYGTWAVTG